MIFPTIFQLVIFLNEFYRWLFPCPSSKRIHQFHFRHSLHRWIFHFASADSAHFHHQFCHPFFHQNSTSESSFHSPNSKCLHCCLRIVSDNFNCEWIHQPKHLLCWPNFYSGERVDSKSFQQTDPKINPWLEKLTY